jgi:hypothetical protein
MVDHRSGAAAPGRAVWTSKRSAAWPRKSSLQLRRSISVTPWAVRRLSSTDHTSEPFCKLVA